ncbi:MAG: hypothetical protein ONB55_22410 [candidate division KSB1 bacterium]|nr:hypothetical protein [candidate division KSB1 bacterium]
MPASIRRTIYVPAGTGGGGGGSGDITPHLVVEYVDTSGNLQTVTVASDGSTTITGYAPFLVHFDASGTRSVVATTKAAALQDVGYRINYGENLGTTWTYPEGWNLSKDEDRGPPIWGRVFTTTGTKTVRMRCRDSEGNEATIQLTVVVNAQSVTRHIPVTDGGWGTIVSGGHYTLDAGSDYSGFGSPPTNGLHNVLFSKVGTGADPTLSNVSFDSRQFIDATESSLPSLQTKNIRYLDCNIDHLNLTSSGPMYCGVIRGRARTISQLSTEYIYDNDTTTDNERLSMRHVRGLFLWDLQQHCTVSDSDSFVWIWGAYKSHFYGIDIRHDASAGINTFGSLRVYPHHCDYRYMRIWCTNPTQGGGGELMFLLAMITTQSPDSGEWVETPENGQYGYASGGLRRNILEMAYACDLQLGASGDYEIDGSDVLVVGGGPGRRYAGAENIAYYRTTTSKNVKLEGAHVFGRNIRTDMGAGSSLTINGVSLPDPWNGPYLIESTNSRPVPTPF